MRGREHIAVAAGSTFVAMSALGWGGDSARLVAAAMVAASAGALAPDIDHRGSLASLSIPSTLLAFGGGFLLLPWAARQWPLLAALDVSGMSAGWFAAAWLAVGVAVMLLAASLVAGAVFGHRGLVHSIGFGAGATAVMAALLAVTPAPVWLAMAFGWGWITHLATDALTPAGLRHALWPLERG